METSFKLPMATMQLSWAVPRVARSARGAVLAQMLELCVREQLRAVSYDAGVAGSAVALGSSTSGFELSAYGYSQRLETLLDSMLHNVVNLEQGYKGIKRFKEQKTRLMRALADANKQAPNAYAAQVSQHLTRRTHWLPEQLLAALKPLQLPDLLNFGKAITRDDHTSVEALVLGNLDAARAEKMLAAASKKLVAKPLAFAERPRQVRVRVEPEPEPNPNPNPNPTEDWP